MRRITTRSNPTNLTEIPRERVGVSLSEVAGQRFFTVSKLDLQGLGLPEDLQIICIARAGGASQRYSLGTVALPKHSTLALDRLPSYASTTFRILVRPADSPRLVASREGVRLANADEGSESVLPMESDDLGEQLWTLVMRDDGPVLKYNARVFPTAAGALTYPPFAALVLPEALRGVLRTITNDLSVLSDESDPLFPWAEWTKSLVPDLPSDDASDDDLASWRELVVEKFARRHKFATDLSAMILKGTND